MARYQHIDLTLSRDALHSPWGFRLKGGVDYDMPLFIERVAVGGSADGQLQPGDQLLALQGQNAAHLAHQDATSIIQNAGSQLSISLLRPIGPAPTQPRLNSATTASRWRSNSESEEKPKIATNSNLAKLMTSALSTTANGTSWSPSRCRTPTLRRGPTMSSLHMEPPPGAPEQDITLFLPKRPLGRQTPLPQHPHPLPHESQLRSQVRDALTLRSPTGSGRTTPTVLEIGSPQGRHQGRPPTAVGVWTPPVHQPNSKLVHMQYNSPMSLYTPNNVADMIEKQTGTKIAWQKKPPVRFLDDINDSPTYQYVQAIERQRPMRAQSEEPLNQSLTLRHLQRYYDRANVH